MKVLVSNHNLVEHGTYFRALKFATYLAEQGHDVTMFTSSERWYKHRKYSIGKVKIVETPSWSLVTYNDNGVSPLGLIYRLLYVMYHNFDIVYAFSHRPVDFIPSYFLKLVKKAYYITDWCDWYGKGGIVSMCQEIRRKDKNINWFKHRVLDFYDWIDKVLEEAAPKRANLTTVICTALYERALEIGIKKEELLKVHSGADIEKVFPVDKEESRNALDLVSLFEDKAEYEKSIFLGYTANYHPDEDLLLEAFGIVSKKFPNARLLLVGPPLRTKEKRLEEIGCHVSMIKKGEKVKAKHNVLFFDRVPFEQIKYFLGGSDILLLPMTDIIFNRGRWPHKTGDYLASGRPVVTNRVGDIPEIVEGKDCAKIADDNPKDYAEKICAMIEDRDRWDEYGKNARKIAETYLNWNRVGDILNNKLKEKFGE